MSDKIKTQKELKRVIAYLRKQGKKIVFTNGCFDILHYGHIKYLQDAKGLADVLVLGLNSDSSVKKIKGSARPINKQLDRARVLSALSCVDYLTIFSEDTPLRLIRLIQPDVLVKGGDWQTEKIVGADFVKARGGKVLAIPYIKGYSTTKLINKIRSPRLF